MIDSYFSRVACNTYTIFNFSNEGIVIDPGYDGNGAIVKHLEKLGIEVKAVFLTHGHYDHIDGLDSLLKRFPNAKVYASEDELNLLENPKLNLSSLREDSINRNFIISKDLITPLTDNEIIESCGFKIRMIKTPFHTSGSCCYLIESENALFSGDTLFFTTIGRTDLPTGSVKSVETSLKKLKCLNEKLNVYPGHGPRTTIEREVKYNSYLRNL